MYSFSIKDYRAIKSANIRIDGITVLAGVNGSGKSTLSRWMYYLINATHEFENYQRKYLIESLETEVNKIQRLFRGIPKNNGYQGYQTVARQLNQLLIDNELDIDALETIYYSFVIKAEEDLREYANNSNMPRRLAMYLIGNEASEELDSDTIINNYLQECRTTFDSGISYYKEKTESYLKRDLERVIASEFSDGEQFPSNITLIEGEKSLIESEHFTPPLMLSRAIYIDSPMAVSGRNYFFGKDIWSEFHEYLYEENPEKKEKDVVSLSTQIQSVIGGEIQLKEDKFDLDKEIHYVSKDSGIDINFEDAATGIKSFAYLSQLLKNGWLDKETLLLIDEPEAHLHPQWIVEFARLLVKIHKELGVKIVIASHNPDMVAAIQSIAQKEQIIDDVVFYLAEKNDNEVNYTFVDKGIEISDIFESFNIALSRIELYGSTKM